MKNLAFFILLIVQAVATGSCAPNTQHADLEGLQCHEIPSLEVYARSIEKRGLKWVLIGEEHGTVESPRLFGDFLCNLGREYGSVSVGLEISTDAQEMLDRYFEAEKSPGSPEEFFRDQFWLCGGDGRISPDYLDMLVYLRELRERGIVTRVFAFGAPTSEGMADNLFKFGEASPGLVVSFMGSFHALRSEFGNLKPVGAHLPDDRTNSLLIRGNGGEAWNCLGVCGVSSSEPRIDPSERRLVYPVDGYDGFDGVLEIGTKTTASDVDALKCR